MKKSLQRISLYEEDAKGLLKLLKVFVPVFLLLIALKQTPRFLDWIEKGKLKNEAYGIVVEKNSNEEIYQTEEGAKIRVKGYDIRYSFQVDGTKYVREEYVDMMKYVLKEQAQLKKIKVGDTLLIKYRLKDTLMNSKLTLINK